MSALFDSRPVSAKEAHEWANRDRPNAYWACSGCGRIEMAITLADARSCSHPGPCDDDVAKLAHAPYIAEQLAAIKPETLREVLAEYGAWDAGELTDHEQNLQRALWIFCNDIAEENT